MAKKARKGPTKSSLIREYLAAHPSEGPQAVAAAMKTLHGITISPQFVSTTKSNDKKRKKRGRKPGRPAGTAPAPKLSMDVLLAAKKFVDSMGGVDKAKSAVDTLAKLLG